jgi:hypothetical protein
MDPMAIPPADMVRIAAEAKSKVMRAPPFGGARAACDLSVTEMVCMARVLDALLIDAFPAPRWTTPPADRPKPVSEL